MYYSPNFIDLYTESFIFNNLCSPTVIAQKVPKRYKTLCFKYKKKTSKTFYWKIDNLIDHWHFNEKLIRLIGVKSFFTFSV